MNVQTAELEGHLSEYLRQIRSTGEAITVCEGDEPVATLAPVASKSAKNGINFIDRLLAKPVAIKDFKPLDRDEIYER